VNKEINQKVTQFLDDELHHSELDYLLLKIKQQPELKNQMNRYHAVSHLLSGEDVLMADISFLDKVSQEIKQEPHHFLPKQPINIKPLALWPKTSVALAASFAIIAVIASQQVDKPVIQSQMLVENKIIEDVPTKVANVSQHERFKAYLQAHSDDIYTHGSLSYQPLAQVASFSQQ
jgi:negative regulator of sigma E activity